MTETTCWLSTDAFARLAGISPQAARKALKRSLDRRPWRETHLVVRTVLARGGRKGVGYEVARMSLPAGLRTEASAQPAAPAFHAKTSAADQTTTIARRWGAVAPVLDYPMGSRARADAAAAASTKVGCGLRTVYRWIDRYEVHGIAGLARARASNAGNRRVLVSRTFDKAFRHAGHSDQALGEIGERLDVGLKGLWASRAEAAGWREVRRMAEFLLQEACEAKGLHLPSAAFRLSRRGVERFASFRVVNRQRNDRKGFDDAKPRIRRDWTMLAPMERVVADVKHLDVIVRRPDGSRAWPKIVAFMDAGTGRIFAQPVLLDRGEGVRQEHVIEAFLAMVNEPNWGFPRGLYLDNGSEFAALVKMQGALNALDDAGAPTLIFARPYNAAAKPIESLFARLDRHVFSMLPGYAGPNRMAQKTQTVGRPPAPFEGSWDVFCETLGGLLLEYQRRPVGGLWNDRSPEEWFAEKAAAGWRPTTVAPLTLDAAFCDHDSRRIDRGVVKVRGQRYSHSALASLPGRAAVDIALPWRRDATPLARIPNSGWVRLKEDAPYPARWLEGARESGRRQNLQSSHIANLAREAPPLDPIAVKLRMVSRPSPIPSLPGGPRMDLGAERQDLGAALATAPAAPETASETRRRREMAITERLEQQHGRTND